MGLRVKAGEGQEVKCLQGLSGLGLSHSSTSRTGQVHRLASGHHPSCPLPGRLLPGWVGPAGDESIQSRLSADCLLIWSEAMATSAPPSTRTLSLLPDLQGLPAPLAPHLRSRCSCRRVHWGQGGHGYSCLPPIPTPEQLTSFSTRFRL